MLELVMSVMSVVSASSPSPSSKNKSYDYLLKFLLVGDSDVGKEEILSGLADGSRESPYGYSNGEINIHSININKLVCAHQLLVQAYVHAMVSRV